MMRHRASGNDSGDRNKVSIIVPAWREQANLRPLCERVFAELKKADIEGEMIVVDDNSKDGSEELVQELGKQYPISIEVRLTEKGLSSAVVHGFKLAKNGILVCMDADLQHDPKYLPSVIQPLQQDQADFVVGSRNVDGGKVEDWPLVRRIISSSATMLAMPLSSCSDPMSGFFGLRRETFQQHESRLNPMGYKIGLELLVRCRCEKVKEVPIVFRDREAGESKLTMKQNLLYVIQLAHLYWDRFPLLVICCVILALYVLITLKSMLF